MFYLDFHILLLLGLWRADKESYSRERGRTVHIVRAHITIDIAVCQRAVDLVFRQCQLGESCKTQRKLCIALENEFCVIEEHVSRSLSFQNLEKYITTNATIFVCSRIFCPT